MTRLYSTKLTWLLVLVLQTGAIHAAKPVWKEVISKKPAAISITSTGNISTQLEISVEVPGFYMEKKKSGGVKYQQLTLAEGHYIADQGCPDLQKLAFTIELPDNYDAEITISGSSYKEFHRVNIMPSAGNQARYGEKYPVRKGEAYSNNVFYPGKLSSTVSPFVVRNTRAQVVEVFPFQYNPATRTLRVYDHITLNLKLNESLNTNPLTADDKNILMLAGMKPEFVNKQAKLMKSAKLPSESGRMLIVCPPAFMNSIQPLAQWREATGTPVEIADASKFSNPEQLFSFIKEYYRSKGDLAFVLLVGDAAQVPTYVLPYGSSDNYFSYLSGNDHYPDVLVGRFSAETSKDVDVQVKRTLLYEQNPGTDPSWITTATGIASTLTPGDDQESDFQHVRNLLNTLKSTTYKAFNEFFDGSQGGGDANGNPATTSILEKINQGTGVIFYAGHGSVTTMATGLINKSAIDVLHNKDKFPIISAAACDVGNFAGQTCVAEAWLRATDNNGNPTGAVAVHMSSGTQTSYPPMEAQDKIAKVIAEPVEGTLTLGSIVVSGLMSMNNIYGDAGYAMTDTYILFGDPALHVRTAQPENLIVKHNGSIGEGRREYKLSCNARLAKATITLDGKIIGTTNVKNGTGTILLDKPASGQKMELAVTALNFLPFISDIKVQYSPASVENCYPPNHSQLQPINSRFSWNPGDGGNPDSYRFYLGTDNPPTNIVNGAAITKTLFDSIKKLNYSTTYYWQVLAINNYGSNQSKVMDFKTVFQPDEDFESNTKKKLTWGTEGAQPWIVDEQMPYDGLKALKSGIVNAGEFTSAVYQCSVEDCEFVSFWNRTSGTEGDVLQFLLDGTKLGEWSGASDWKLNSYKVEAGDHRLEWRFVKAVTSTSDSSAAWIDDIHLPIHSAAISLASSASICEGSALEIPVDASNYFSIHWETPGDGIFSDPCTPTTTYQPGAEDTGNHTISIKLSVNRFEGCPVIEKQLALTINQAPLINLPSDTIINQGYSVQLDATAEEGTSYFWNLTGETTPVINVTATGTRSETKEVVLTVTSAENCTAVKAVHVHFNSSAKPDEYRIYPNPSNGVFNIAPVSGSALFNKMSLVDVAGNVVWQHEEASNVIGSKQVQVPGVAKGTYVLITENENGRAVNKVMIR